MKNILQLLLAIIVFISIPVSAQQNNFENTTLLGKLNPNHGTDNSNIWGYSANGKEYALMGTYEGTSIIDVTNPSNLVEVAFVPGVNSLWRELRTFGHYAYVVSEGSSNVAPLSGLQIIDLANLPNSAALVNTYVGVLGNSGRAHTIHIDGKYAYLNGSQTAQGVHILDLADPVNPVAVGSWTQDYWHDSVVKNDTIYASGINGAGIQILDAGDKANLKLISQTQYPNLFTHNIWPTDDNKYIVETDEIHGMPLNFWDVSDKAQPELLAEHFLGNLGIAHNAHVRGNFVYVSYYFDGIKIFDLSERKAPVEVGHFDTYPDDNLNRGNGYEGAWGVFPYLPSGKILISDISTGLYVVKFDTTYSGYISGEIKDQDNNPVSDVKIELLNRHSGEGETRVKIGTDGKYIFGAKPGNRSFLFSKFGYVSQTVSNINVISKSTVLKNSILIKKPINQINLSVKNKLNENVTGSDFTIWTDGFRETYTDQPSFNLPVGIYNYSITKWGYGNQAGTFEIKESGPSDLTVTLDDFYYETFTNAQSWDVENENLTNKQWTIDKAENLPSSRFLNYDKTGDAEGYVADSYSRGSAGNNGRTTYISPVFDALKFSQPTLSFSKYYNPYGYVNGDVKDSLNVYISNDNGSTWKKLVSYTSIDNSWVEAKFEISSIVTPTSFMKVKFDNIEGDNSGTRYSSFAMIDDIKFASKSAINSVYESNGIPDQIVLEHNYPNPFNPATTLKWNQPFSAQTDIVIFNALGQKVKTLSANGNKGNNSKTINFEKLSSGIYYYEIKSKNLTSKTGKLTLIK